ncbi:2741_t:CDS:2 [Funneliformis caledonium]|uniref:Serine/threonine-protein phosphatase 2A activator n=1 Tax=Funneliformis caledonium TaxID=1117310 RepID=A0A9N9FRX3_9GLOM|nr:2741_t:CDS:2 [Funneliformis caledonium]
MAATTTFIVPKRQILTKEDLEKFHDSDAFNEFIGFIERLNNSVKGLSLTTECFISPTLSKMLEILDQMNAYCEEIPPVQNEKSRFGNPAFRDFYDRVVNNAEELHENFSLPSAAIKEVSRYFMESWGNRKRIDYGTGHEANFMAWLLCFEKLGLIGSDDYASIILRVFQKYIDIMRNLQFKYWLEPAGSHGVWGLDDYHFLPFMFGSSQLIGHKYIKPKSIHDKDIVDEFSKDFMYLSWVKEWKKVNEGMIKMYKGEVLGKLPIMQHFMFGKFPDCCGIKIPSAVGASQMNMKEGKFRRLPFD